MNSYAAPILCPTKITGGADSESYDSVNEDSASIKVAIQASRLCPSGVGNRGTQT